jgi:outer membrane protein OmpA-like peptidoglycan-associated protein
MRKSESRAGPSDRRVALFLISLSLRVRLYFAWHSVCNHGECLPLLTSANCSTGELLAEGDRAMRRQLAFLVLCSGFNVLSSGCATKSFVETQLSATETKLTQRVDTQEAKLRETADRAGASRQAIDEMGALASDAKTRAATALDAEARLAQRLADRNKFRLLETRSIYFDSGKTEIRRGDMSELEDVAKALKDDANAILELQGFADPRGNDRRNNELARERVEAVTRYLVQRHGIELRQLRGFSMGKVALEKPSTEAFAKARRVDIRLLAPWSSWEDAQAPVDRTAAAQTPADHPSAEAGAAAPKSTKDDEFNRRELMPGASVKARYDQPATPQISPRSRQDRDALQNATLGNGVLEILKTISPKELGGED